MRQNTRSIAQATLLAVTALLAADCGYTWGSGLHGYGVRTVALTLVANDSFRQRLEVELAAALARELPISTDLRLASRDRADASLEVRITEARERTLVPGTTLAPVREGTLAAAVTMRLIDAAGQVLIEQVLLDRTEFRNPIGENLTSARAELVNDIARKVTLALDGHLVIPEGRRQATDRGR
ncbi:MAG: LPS assembly lipoprotein LptE [bacterium]|nr:LPS assembly lipoprotein LptE [bacterium]